METRKFGWKRQPEDHRDYTVNFALLPGKKAILPVSVDLRSKCPPIEDQGSHGTCTAFAYCGVASFMENKQGHGFPAFSENFVYYETVKNIEHGNPLNDPGATIRDTFAEAKQYGVCKAATWPYDNPHFGKAPSATAVAEALNYQLISYATLDPIGTAPATIVGNIKNMIAAGYPVEFGFDVYSSFMQIGANGLMSYPAPGEAYQGGHAVDVVGYNDTIRCPNTNTPGAFLVRNSWGAAWGLAGHFWMPYEIVTRPFNGRRMASDFWAEGSIEWMNRGA